MSTSGDESRVVREVLLEALEGGNYDTHSLREHMRDDSHFTKEIGIDSLDLLEFFLRIEDRFKIQIHDDDYGSLTSVQAVADFLKEKHVAPEP